MSLKHLSAFVAVVLAVTALTVTAQNPPPRPVPPQTPAPSADPYAANPNAGATQFPLAAGGLVVSHSTCPPLSSSQSLVDFIY